MITWEIKAYTTNLLLYIDQMRIANIYTLDIRENLNKKLKFDTMISVVKTSIQIAVIKGVISELTRLLIEFITKYCWNISLNIREVYYILQLNNKIQEPSAAITDSCNILKISNLKYHKPKGHPLKHYKSSIEENNIQQISSSFKTCSYYLKKGYNIRGCK